MELYKINKSPYYWVQTEQEKAYIVKILAKYGLTLDKPRSKTPFYISIHEEYENNGSPSKRTYIANIVKNEKSCYGIVTPLNDFEDNLVLECFPEVAFNACQSIATAEMPPDYQISKTIIFKTKDGRIFEIYTHDFDNKTKYYNVNLRDESYFRRATIEPRAEAIAIDYVKF